MKSGHFLLLSLYISWSWIFPSSNSIAIPDNSPLYSQPFIHGPDDFRNGSLITLFCNLSMRNPEKEVPKYTFIMMKNENCHESENVDLTKYVEYQTTMLLLRYPTPPSFQGKKTFACVKKDKMNEPPPGCHTAFVGSIPGKPKISCVSHGFRRIRCAVTPSGEEMRKATKLILPRHMFSQSYSLTLPGYKTIECSLDPVSRRTSTDENCVYLKNGTLIYTLPNFIVHRFEIRIRLKNLFGESQVAKNFSMCQIEQPIIGTFMHYDVEPESAKLIWNISDTFFPHDKEYFLSEINCTSPTRNSTFNDSTFANKIVIPDLQPFTLYECSVVTRTNLRTKAHNGAIQKCAGLWSEPKITRFRTNPSAPKVGPLAPPGMIFKNGNRCTLNFFEIPEEDRNGYVDLYRVQLSLTEKKLTKILNPTFMCSKFSKTVSIAGKTKDGGWSPPSKLDFSFVSERQVGLELWKQNGTYQPKVLYSKEFKLKEIFLAVCNCGSTCDRPDFQCIEMRQLKPKILDSEELPSGVIQSVLQDITVSLNEEKVLAHVSFEKQASEKWVPYAMSEWTSCTYDRNIKKKSEFQRPKHEIIAIGKKVTFRFNQQDLACSEKIIKPVHKIVTRVKCNEKFYKEITTPIVSFKPVTINAPLKSEVCKVLMSLNDDNNFQSLYTSKGSDSVNILLLLGIVAGVVAPVLFTLLICCYKKETIKDKCRTLCEDRQRRDDNFVNPSMSYCQASTYKEGYGYDSIEPVETGDAATEDSSTEQGMGTGHTELLRDNVAETTYVPH